MDREDLLEEAIVYSSAPTHNRSNTKDVSNNNEDNDTENIIDTKSEELVQPNDTSEDNNEIINNEEIIDSILEPMTEVEPSDVTKTEGADINTNGTSVTAQNMEKLMQENEKNSQRTFSKKLKK